MRDIERVIIDGGGFHNVPDIEFRAEIIKIDGKMYAMLNKRQFKRLQKHFCGMTDCMCYSWPTPHPDYSGQFGPYCVPGSILVKKQA